MMEHLTDKIAEFVFEELLPSDMIIANRHAAECPSCRIEVEQFQQTHAMLKTSMDVEPPRRIIFEAEKPRMIPWVWRWLAPMAASAAVALMVVQLSPQRPQLQIVERVVPAPQVAVPASQLTAQPIDYQKIINELRDSERAWLAQELKKRDVMQEQQIQRVRGDLAFMDTYQRATYREMAENAAAIQLLAQRTDAR
jgi:hypothetical protein